MKTKKPSAIVYGLDRLGTETIYSDVYFEESLYDECIIYSLEYNNQVVEDYSKYQPDLIISFGEKINIPDYRLSQIHLHL